MFDALSQFRDAIRDTGLEPPDVIEDISEWVGRGRLP